MSYFIVIAGNKEQFHNWVREWGFSGEMKRRKGDFTYISDPNKIRGLSLNGGNKVVFVGTYWQNPVYRSPELAIQIKLSGARPMIFGDEDFYTRLIEQESTNSLLAKFVGLLAPFALRYLWAKKTPALQLIREVWCELIGRGVSLPPPDLNPDDIVEEEKHA
jgi:hypothetical protein